MFSPEREQLYDTLQNFFMRYGNLFVDLAAAKRSDHEELLLFYSAPVRIITNKGIVLLEDDLSLLGPKGLAGEVEKYHGAGFRSSELTSFGLSALNARAVLASATWMRCGPNVADFESRALYLVVLTDNGWRIVTVLESTL